MKRPRPPFLGATFRFSRASLLFSKRGAGRGKDLRDCGSRRVRRPEDCGVKVLHPYCGDRRRQSSPSSTILSRPWLLKTPSEGAAGSWGWSWGTWGASLWSSRAEAPGWAPACPAPGATPARARRLSTSTRPSRSSSAKKAAPPLLGLTWRRRVAPAGPRALRGPLTSRRGCVRMRASGRARARGPGLPSWRQKCKSDSGNSKRRGTWEFPGQGWDLSHSSGNAGSLTH